MYPYYLTPKEYEILQHIYTFRFLNRVQIQQILNHKDKKRINAWLKKLTDDEYLGRIYSKKLLENTKPAIYYLNHNGISYLKDQKYAIVQKLKKYYEDNKRSEVFRNHCLFIADMFLQMNLDSNQTDEKDSKKTVQIQFLTRAKFQKRPVLQELNPDIYWVRKSINQNLYTLYYR